LIIAAIAVSSYIHSSMRANEVSAVASLRVINTSVVADSISYPNQGFAAELPSLGNANPCTGSSTLAGLIDDVLAQRAKSGSAIV
jgi:hypothetical protein